MLVYYDFKENKLKTWHKREASKESIREISQKYKIDTLTASILARRGITDGKDIMFYLEDDLRFQHNPFLFSAMTDAVERIMQARDEEEKVLVFGDRDVDGVTATTVLFNCLKDLGIKAQWRVPGKDDPYGLNERAVNEFAQDGGSLIITVDCGISNVNEVALAVEKGIDVIVTDHHTPPEIIPDSCVILNPKVKDSGYPFADISGCAVAYKLATALRYAQSNYYNTESCLFNIDVSEDNTHITLECAKVKNMIMTNRVSWEFDASEEQTSLNKKVMAAAHFMTNQHLFVWDMKSMQKKIAMIFGSADAVAAVDLRDEISKLLPKLKTKSLKQLKTLSKIVKYTSKSDSELTDMDGFFNIFVTYLQKKFENDFPLVQKKDEEDLQLVTLAALADIMPLVNENRIFAKNGLKSINSSHIRAGLQELMMSLNMLGKKISSTDLSWSIVPSLNAAGRMGQAELAAELFLTERSDERYKLAQKIIELNQERKELGKAAETYAFQSAEESIKAHNGKLCLIIDERINRGVSGILAAKLVQCFGVPSITVTFPEGDIAVGSMRSCKDFSVTNFLDQFGDIFINHGGHKLAGGFSFLKKDLERFKQKAIELSSQIELKTDEGAEEEVDAEIPLLYMTPKLLDILDKFEPYGEQNPALVFMSKKVPVLDARVLGNAEPFHLKLNLNCGANKWTALFWKEAARLNNEFGVGDNIDILYQISRNTFNGIVTPQIILSDLKKSN